MARAARQKGGVAHLQCVQKSSSMRLRRAVRFDPRRLTKKLPANSHPPPSVGCAALRRHLPPSGWRITIALAGRVGSAEWRQPEAPWFAQAPQSSPATSAVVRAGAPKLASQKRPRRATVTRPPLGADGARSATEGVRGASATRSEKQLNAPQTRGALRSEASHQEAPSQLAPAPLRRLRCAAPPPPPLRGGGLLLPWRGELGPRSGAKRIQYPLDSAKTRANK